jgi:hypothetical protein
VNPCVVLAVDLTIPVAVLHQQQPSGNSLRKAV